MSEISMADIISHYQIIGLGIAVALGIAAKELIFSISNDVIVPSMGGLFKSKFFDNYTLDLDKFLGAIITFIIVTAVIIFLLYVVLQPIVKKEIRSSRERDQTISDDLDHITSTQDKLVELQEEKQRPATRSGRSSIA